MTSFSTILSLASSGEMDGELLKLLLLGWKVKLKALSRSFSQVAGAISAVVILVILLKIGELFEELPKVSTLNQPLCGPCINIHKYLCLIHEYDNVSIYKDIYRHIVCVYAGFFRLCWLL